MQIKKVDSLIRPYSDIQKASFNIITERKSGLIKSLKTPWNRFNKSMLNGLDWKKVYTWGARPGAGKTSLVTQITNTAHALNPDQDFAILNFQFEMTDVDIGVRELTKPTGLDMNQLLSANGSLTDADYNKVLDFQNKNKKPDIYFVTEPVTALKFGETVIDFYNTVKKPIVVTIDHSVLVKKDLDEKSQMDTIKKFCDVLVELKKNIPQGIFMVISQMNREIENSERRMDGKIGNYPSSTDLFGSDSLVHASDVVGLLTRPDLVGIKLYGPEKIRVYDGLAIMHLIKNRLGKPSMLFFKQNLQYFEMNEAPVPNELIKK